jgi:hypothetical protein
LQLVLVQLIVANEDIIPAIGRALDPTWLVAALHAAISPANLLNELLI